MNKKKPQPAVFYKVDIVVIGAGQAGLSAAYHLKKQGIAPGKGFVVLDDEFGAGGAWQHRWDSLTLSTVNGINDLPGMSFADATDIENASLQANIAVPDYYEKYEKHFELPVIRPVCVKEVYEKNERFFIETNGVQFSAKGIINATGTWKTPFSHTIPVGIGLKAVNFIRENIKMQKNLSVSTSLWSGVEFLPFNC